MMNSSTHPPPAPSAEPCFEIDGLITEVLPGCGLAAIHANNGEFTLSRATEGVNFDDLRVGQKIHCQVAQQNHRVLHGHLQTQPLHIGTGAARLSPSEPARRR